MNAFKKATASLIMAVLILAIAAPAALAAPAPGNGPGEKDVNGGETRPNQARQGHRWDEETPPVNPPPSGGPAAPTQVGTETGTILVVKVYGDLNADGVWDLDEVDLEDVIIVLKTEAGMSVRFEETDEMGQVCFLNLTPGEYVLDVRPPTGDFLPAEVPVEIVTGQNVVEIGLKPVSGG